EAGRERVRFGGGGCGHGDAAVTAWGRAGARVDDVGEMARWVECETLRCRGGDGAVGQFQNGISALDPDLPRTALGIAERADLAHVDHGGGDARLAQQLDDAVSDPALADAVEGQGHAGTGEGDAVAADADRVEADEGAGF